MNPKKIWRVAVLGLAVSGCVVLATVLLRQTNATKPSDTARLDLLRLVNVAKEFQTNNARLPQSLDELIRSASTKLQRDDPWGRAYRMNVTPGELEFSTLGQDGAAGGDGENRDYKVTLGPAAAKP
jgi:hypothetical protein